VEAVSAKAVAERSTAKSRSSTERAATKPAPAAKPAATVEATPAMKSSTSVETASTAMGSTAAMAAAAPGECQRRRTKNHERKNCKENYRQDLLHFSPSKPTARDCPTGTNFRRGHLRWQPTYGPILHPRRASKSKTAPFENAERQRVRRPIQKPAPPARSPPGRHHSSRANLLVPLFLAVGWLTHTRKNKGTTEED